jgi:hypothetical protein
MQSERKLQQADRVAAQRRHTDITVYFPVMIEHHCEMSDHARLAAYALRRKRMVRVNLCTRTHACEMQSSRSCEYPNLRKGKYILIGN